MPAPTGDPATVVTTIAGLCQSWPDAIHTEIEQFELSGAVISIPLSQLENGMKTGRVVVAWSDILSWLNPPTDVPSAQGSTELELPLNVVAASFHRKAPRCHSKNCYHRSRPHSRSICRSGQTRRPAPTPAPVVPTPVIPAPVRPPEIQRSGKAFGQPTKLEWSPQEIARQIAALPGVSGSLLATTNGLLVAGQIAPPLTSETLATFAPQVFGRISSYADEIKLAVAVRAVTLTTDTGPCAMFQARAGFFYRGGGQAGADSARSDGSCELPPN